MNPQDAANLAEGRIGDEMTPELPAGDGDGVTDAPESSGGRSIVDGLLETQPAGSVRSYPDMPTWSAHALIGTQKMINGMAGDRDLDGGKPAIVDFVQAGVSFATGADGRSTEPEPEAEPIPESDVPGDVGGEVAR